MHNPSLQAPLLCALFFSWIGIASCLPLSVNSRWIVDQLDGSRVKLACVNWASHLQPMLAEGLSNQPLNTITSTIRSLGFNCVRLTWPTFMFTNATLGQQTVSQSFSALNLTRALAGILNNNPELVGMTLIEAFKAVVSSLGEYDVMVILDNHISKPGWCCSDKDGNGFFGDEYFDPNVWLEGLRKVASTFRDSVQVIGMSMRNELRGPRQNIHDWYKYMQMGAETVHSANPNVLVIHSGLSYDTDLRFLFSQHLNESLQNKVVYEVHWYSFANGNSYITGNLNHICASITQGIINRSGFLVMPNKNSGGPLFISEFGIDARGTDENENRFMSCFFAFAAGGDFDWAYWPLQGSYYLRNGRQDNEEFYGVLTADWDRPRNISFLKRLQVLQKPFIQDLSLTSSSQILFHPASGLCLQADQINGLNMGSCETATSWSFDSEGGINMMNSNLCVVAQAEEQPVVLGNCEDQTWQIASETQMQFSTQVGANLTAVCLDGSSPPSVLAKPCICTNDNNCSPRNDPSVQWFKLITKAP